ncbi:MAG: hypothetical protein E7577_05040 [Ruminococcaceae bacterium]|nr:hypothetical protein [Oscillospiraceae bacterium]
MIPENVFVGLFIGLLCGLIPLIYGILRKATIWAIIGIALTAVSGVIFSIFDKSPFNAIVISVLFILFIVAEQKRKSKHDEHDEHDEHNEFDDSYPS